ncbi:MAG: M23 family metallopeptidase [Bacilli bacterium]
MTLEEYRSRNSIKTNNYIKYFKSLFIRCLTVIIVSLVVLIICLSNTSFKNIINNYLFSNNFNFSTINKLYNKVLLGKKDISFVNKENKVDFSDSTKYKDGYSISLKENTPIKLLGSGVVVYIGDKEGYGKTLIMQQSNGVDVWYGNMKEINVTIYDYLEKESIIGTSKNNIYYLFQKNGKALSYKDI